MIALCLMLTAVMPATDAQTAKQVLDKCAKTINLDGGVTANFSMNSAQYGNAQGTISIKGQKFRIEANTLSMWFDGKTLWTYMASNEEVNISNPTQQQLNMLNPYHFISLYKKGYDATITTAAASYQVHLTATDPSFKIKEAFLTIDKGSNVPTEIKTLMGQKWTSFAVSGLKKQKLDDAKFRFDSSKYPDAEIIDLR